MSDIGTKFADKRIRYVDSRISTEYRQAEKELNEKLADFVRKSAERDRIKRKQRDEGIISDQQYKDWLAGQVFIRKRWESKVKQASEVLHTHNLQANKIIHENAMDVFRENYNYSAFTAEMGTGVSFDLINEQTVINLAKKNPQLLPEWKIDEEKDYKWNYRKANNAVMQGIIQGESVDKIAKRMAKNLCTQNKNKMRLFARTAITGAQNGGRQAQMEAAAEDGIEQKKEWVATLDGRTRDSHRRLDGQQVGVNESFEGEFGKIMFPGDPTAHPAEVYNCRCAMITVYPKYAGFVGKTPRRAKSEYTDKDGNKRSFSYLTQDPELYEKWKNAKAINQDIEFTKTGKPKKVKCPYHDEMSEKGYVGLNEKESDEFIQEYHNKSIIGKHGMNTMDGGQSRRINDALRNGKMPEDPADKKLVQRLDSEIEKNALPQDMTLFRGVSMVAFKDTGVFDGFKTTVVNMSDFKKPDGGIDYDKWGIEFAKAKKKDMEDKLGRAKRLVGATIEDKGFMQVSASSERNIFSFSDINIQIHAPEGTKAYISDYKEESEIILQRGTKFVVLEATEATVTAKNGNKMDVIQLIVELVE